MELGENISPLAPHYKVKKQPQVEILGANVTCFMGQTDPLRILVLDYFSIQTQF